MGRPGMRGHRGMGRPGMGRPGARRPAPKAVPGHSEGLMQVMKLLHKYRDQLPQGLKRDLRKLLARAHAPKAKGERPGRGLQRKALGKKRGAGGKAFSPGNDARACNGDLSSREWWELTPAAGATRCSSCCVY